MRKCFEGVRRLEFGEGGSEVVALVSGEGERIALGKPVKARGGVESWLGGVEAAMGASLRRLCHDAMHAFAPQVPAALALQSHLDCANKCWQGTYHTALWPCHSDQSASPLLWLWQRSARHCTAARACAGAHRVDGRPAGTAGAGDLADGLVR